MLHSIFAQGNTNLNKKPNDTPTYISVNSNHLPNIIKALPNSIQNE